MFSKPGRAMAFGNGQLPSSPEWISCSFAKDECDSLVEFTPLGYCTGLVQAMDVSVNRPFKAKLRSLCVDWFKDRTETTTPRGNLKQPTRQQALDWGLGF
eukprot:scpid97575/ scgid32553/ 